MEDARHIPPILASLRNVTSPNYWELPMTPSLLHELRLSRAVGWSSYAILVFDYLLTFQDEVNYIWPSRWSLVKVMFLTNRYGGIVMQAVGNAQQSGIFRGDDVKFCYVYALTMISLMFVSFGSAHLLVILRAWALRAFHKRIAAFLITLCVVFVIASVIICVASIGLDPYPVTVAGGTCIGILPPGMWLIWVASLGLEFGVFGLTLWSLRYHLQESRFHDLSPIPRILYRDGILYFMLIVSVTVLNIVMWLHYPQSPCTMLPTTLSICLVNIAAQRLILDLRSTRTQRDLGLTMSRLSREVDRQIEAFREIDAGMAFMGDSTANEAADADSDVELTVREDGRDSGHSMDTCFQATLTEDIEEHPRTPVFDSVDIGQFKQIL